MKKFYKHNGSKEDTFSHSEKETTAASGTQNKKRGLGKINTHRNTEGVYGTGKK